MAIIQVGEQRLEVDLLVFDKDGLLFDSQYFWQCLAETRMRALSEYMGLEGMDDWCRTFGIQGVPEAITIDPSGIFALAPPAEEAIITASILKKHSNKDWSECHNLATGLFEASDQQFDLLAALKPKAGFPAIFKRLREAGIPYGIATSDDYARTKLSIEKYEHFDSLQFVVTPVDVKRGKPHPDMLDLIARRTGIEPGRIVMIGDSFVDMRMAREAGCIGVGIPDEPLMERKMQPYADFIVRSLADIEVISERTTARI